MTTTVTRLSSTERRSDMAGRAGRSTSSTNVVAAMSNCESTVLITAASMAAVTTPATSGCSRSWLAAMNTVSAS